MADLSPTSTMQHHDLHTEGTQMKETIGQQAKHRNGPNCLLKLLAALLHEPLCYAEPSANASGAIGYGFPYAVCPENLCRYN